MENVKIDFVIVTDAMYKCFLVANTAEEKEVWRRGLLNAIPAIEKQIGCGLKYEGVNC